MISVKAAQTQLLAFVSEMGIETVPLKAAVGRILAQPIRAPQDQPPFASAAMDGYAVPDTGALKTGQSWRVIGEAAAGHPFNSSVAAGQAVRIFTGAPVPDGARKVIIQENTQLNSDGNIVTLTQTAQDTAFIRPRGSDFKAGHKIYPKQITPYDVALMAAMNVSKVPVRQKPTVALISTGDELVYPGETPKGGQIIASNGIALHAMLLQNGATPQLLPITQDRKSALKTALEMAQNSDLIVTIGGASVGDHDLVAPVIQDMGGKVIFHKIAMRPGKPLMAAHLGNTPLIGVPGNPVSALVCAKIFLLPIIRKMLAHTPALPAPFHAPLANNLSANGARQHYMRAFYDDQTLHVAAAQDSSYLSVLHSSNALLIRAPHAPSAKIGEMAAFLPL